MDREQRSIRVGLLVIACAVALRLLTAPVPQPLAAFFRQPEVASFLVYLQTGRVVRTDVPDLPPQLPEATLVQGESASASPVKPPAPAQQVLFQPEDAAAVEVSAYNGYRVDVAQLLLSQLELDLGSGEPAVLILHTHATESYRKTQTDTYQESSAYRTLDTDHNMVRVGAQLAQRLQENGIAVIHDTTFHDYPSYNDSYNNARKTIESYLAQYPSIQLVLDIHRDAADLSSGQQLTTHALSNGAESSQLMMVVGTNANGLHHPNWQKNMALAIKLHALLEKEDPGICRPISFRAERFNQDLSPGALIVEVGAAGDTLQQALTAVEALGSAITALSSGSAAADSTS